MSLQRFEIYGRIRMCSCGKRAFISFLSPIQFFYFQLPIRFIGRLRFIGNSIVWARGWLARHYFFIRPHAHLNFDGFFQWKQKSFQLKHWTRLMKMKKCPVTRLTPVAELKRCKKPVIPPESMEKGKHIQMNRKKPVDCNWKFGNRGPL